MKIITTFCDRCGDNIPDKPHIQYKMTSTVETCNIDGFFCKNCWKEFKTFLKEGPEIVAAQMAKKTPSLLSKIFGGR